MNKKQVGALLKVISKDDTRPMLMVVKVIEYKDRAALAATDGHKLAVLYMDGAEELIGKQIRREAIERWYKLATGKDRLNGEELINVAAEDYGQHNSYADVNFPDVTKVIPEFEPTDGQTVMRFNADFLKTMQDLEGEDWLQFELYGPLQPMVSRTDKGVYVVMPMKKQ